MSSKTDIILLGMAAVLFAAVMTFAIDCNTATVSAETPVLDKLMPYIIGDPEITTAQESATEADPSIGRCRITVYTPYDDEGVWGYQTATGTTSEHLRTCAVDPEVIPLGTELEIKGEKMSLTVKAVDTGSAVKGKRIDVFFDGTVEEAMRFVEEFGDYGEVKIK